MLTAMGIGLFFGAVGKSAQFPLHVWLPDAMEGPTPVSALIHAATMVAAGVYLVGRIFPILTPDAKLFIAIIGCTTLTMAALIAIAQTDIKKVLAYSTLSQLGYMIMAIGLGSYIGGLFHLITHAFFKALLFLGSGSVIHAAHHEQELPQYGGLIRKIPITGITFGIAVLAIAGTPFLSGFFSKDLILAHAGAFATIATRSGGSHWYWLFFILPGAIAFITPFYMTRCWMLTFWGKPRNQHLYDHAHETPIPYAPLVVLAILRRHRREIHPQFAASELIKASITENESFPCSFGWTRRSTRKTSPASRPGSGRAELRRMKSKKNAAEAQDIHEELEPRKPASGRSVILKLSPAAIRSRPRNRNAHAGAGSVSAGVWPRSGREVHQLVAFLVGIGVGFLVYLKGYWIAAATDRDRRRFQFRSSASGCCGGCISMNCISRSLSAA